jgi:4-hydroxy-tetrahydrodipicolinate reductase
MSDETPRKLRLVVPGAAGKMGRMILKVIADSATAQLVAAVERPGSPLIGQDAGLVAGLAALSVKIQAELDEALLQADVIIDFTAPAATAWTVSRAAEHGVGMVIGTTGLGEAEKRAVWQAAERIPIVLSANMSLGVNVLFGLIAQAAKALGNDYDVEIVELHHRQKRDAPSGTALAMASTLAEALGRDLATATRNGRAGNVGARTTEEIGIHAVRGGDIVGEHTAYFCGPGERLEVTHRASSRETFAHGALRAAEWLRDRDPGLYDMQDVLGLRR